MKALSEHNLYPETASGKSRKIKIFLGAPINQAQAQGLNCLGLATHLDKNKFEIYTMTVSNRNMEIDNKLLPQIHVINYNPRFKITKKLCIIWGIWKSDVCYLPKHRSRILPFMAWIKILGKKSFATVEGLYDDEIIKSMSPRKLKNRLKSYSKLTKTYSITRFVKQYNLKAVSLKTEESILPIGIDGDTYKLNRAKRIRQLKNIIFIGSDIKRKRLHEFLDLAKLNQDINFHIVSASRRLDKKYIQYIQKNFPNTVAHGKLSPQKLREVLQGIDLHILPSKSEGIGKVIFETAIAGIPSIVYSHYGIGEILNNGENSYVVDSFEEINPIIQDLRQNPQKLQTLSENAVKPGKKFTWEKVIPLWEKEIVKLYYAL